MIFTCKSAFDMLSWQLGTAYIISYKYSGTIRHKQVWCKNISEAQPNFTARFL